MHVAGHLLVGMVAPLLLVTAAPVTLALRVLPRRRARVLARLLRSRPVVVLTHPVVAAVVDVGGLWLLYRTGLHAALPPAVVHLHMLLAGYLFAFSLVGRDPAPHRPGLAVRAGVLVAAVAAHDVLAKLLYAAQAETAGLLMYYGAAPVHLALFVLLGQEWFAGAGAGADAGSANLGRDGDAADRALRRGAGRERVPEPGSRGEDQRGGGAAVDTAEHDAGLAGQQEARGDVPELGAGQDRAVEPAAGEVGEVQRGGKAADVADLGQQRRDDVGHQLLRRGGRVEAEPGQCLVQVGAVRGGHGSAVEEAPSPEIALNVSPTTGSCTTASARSSSPGPSCSAMHTDQGPDPDR